MCNLKDYRIRKPTKWTKKLCLLFMGKLESIFCSCLNCPCMASNLVRIIPTIIIYIKAAAMKHLCPLNTILNAVHDMDHLILTLSSRYN